MSDLARAQPSSTIRCACAGCVDWQGMTQEEGRMVLALG